MRIAVSNRRMKRPRTVETGRGLLRCKTPVACAPGWLELTDQARDRAAFAEELDRAAGRGLQLAVRVDAELGEDRGSDIVRRAGVVGGLHAVGVGGAVDVAALETAAGQDDRHRAGPVVAAGILVDAWGAAELAGAI